MGLQNPYTPVRFRSWPRTIEYMPGWRNGIREGLKILCQQWLAGSSPASGTTTLRTMRSFAVQALAPYVLLMLPRFHFEKRHALLCF